MEVPPKGASFGTDKFDGEHHDITKNDTWVFGVFSLLPLRLVQVYRIVRLLLVLLLGRWAAAWSGVSMISMTLWSSEGTAAGGSSCWENHKRRKTRDYKGRACLANAQCAFCQVRWPCGQKLKSKNTLSDGKKIFLRLFFLCCFRKKTLKLVSLFIFRH